MNIHLHIDRLVVDEAVIGSGGREHLQAAVEAELARLLAAGDLAAQWPKGGNFHSLPGGNIQLQKGSHSTHVGTQIAQTVYGAIHGTSGGGQRNGSR